ncbi:MAG: hypothetical protein AB7K71_07915 [Polyangiaceae bacterium]
MGTKLFCNNTGKDLSVELEVRRGDSPSETLDMKSFSLSRGQSMSYTYSTPQNPYLNGMSVNAADGSSVIAEQQFIFKRGSELDNEFNMNDTVTFGLIEQSITVKFTNS